MGLKMFSCYGTVNTAVVREFNSAVMQILIQKKMVIPYIGCLLALCFSVKTENIIVSIK